MKTLTLVLTVAFYTLFLFTSNQAYSQAKDPGKFVDAEFKALGLCGMCKTRIESAALNVRGVRSAVWNQNKQLVSVRFDSSRTNQETIERAIARAGHDTQNFITDEVTYNNLHHCCKYPRDPQMIRTNRVHNQ